MRMVSSAIADSFPIAAHHPLGSSTGHFADLRGDWDALVSEALRTSTLAAELAALSEPEFLTLHDWLAQPGRSLPFRFLSVHAPSKHRQLSEEELVQKLATLPRFVNAIVVHPETIEQPQRYEQLGSTLVIENMDSRKSFGRNVHDLEQVFAQLPRAGFCFDIAHAKSVDPSMGVAHELLDAFGERLRHVHVSSVDADCHHVQLTREDEAAFASVLNRCRDVPWILESALPTGI